MREVDSNIEARSQSAIYDICTCWALGIIIVMSSGRSVIADD